MKNKKEYLQICITDRTAAALIRKAAQDEERSLSKIISRAIIEKYGKEPK